MVSSNQKVANIIQTWTTLHSKWARFRKEAVRNYEYVMGDQISEKQRKMLAKERRPAKITNLIQDKIVAIAGTIENNHAYMKAIPVREGDEQGAQMHTVLVSDWAMKNCHGYKEIARAAVDAAIAKIGWVNNYVDYRKNPEGEWVTESFDPFMVMFDPLSRKQDLSDANYIIISAWYTADQIISIYKHSKQLTPEMIAKIREEDAKILGEERGDTPRGWADKIGSITDSVSQLWSKDHDKDTIGDWIDARSGIYRVVEMHDKRYVSQKTLYDPRSRAKTSLRDQQGEESTEDYNAYVAGESAKVGGGIVDETSDEQKWITVIVPGLLPDDVIYEKPYAVQASQWQLTPIFCYNFTPDVTQTGAIVDIFIDPQDSYNQRRMTALEIVMDAVNPSWLVHTGAIPAGKEVEFKSKERGVLRWFQGATAPTPLHPSEGAFNALKLLAEEDRDLVQQLGGLTPNAMGAAETKNESGRLFANRVRQSMVMMAYYLGNITFAMSEVFNFCDKNLQKFMTMPRAIRLLDKKNNPQWIQLNIQTINGVMNDVSQGEYDFVVDTAQVGETAKQMQRAEILELLQIMPPELVPWDKLLKLFDFADVDEWAQYVGEKMGLANELQKKQAELATVRDTAGTVAALHGAADKVAGPAPQPIEQGE